MDLASVTERISEKISAKGHNPDRNRIEGKLRRLVEEFGVPPAEAERTVQNEFFRELGIVQATSGPSEEHFLADIRPGEWVTIEGKVVSLSKSPSPAISWTGILSDQSGSIRFVVWAKAPVTEIRVGSWYRFESAVVDEYRGATNLKVHSGTTVREISRDISMMPVITPIADLKPGVASIRAKMIQEWDVAHDRMLQSGLLGDESGTVRFVIWKEDGKERLSPGAVYTIYYAQVDEFNGRNSLNLNSAMVMPEEGDIVVARGEKRMDGALVHIAPGSGLIKRCPVDGCNRVLSRQNYCPVHEIQPKFVYDLRIKGWLDDGRRTQEILIRRECVESLTGLSLEQAKDMAENNPLGMDEVFYRIRDAILGRFLSCEGREIERRLLVDSCSRISCDTARLAGLLNRAGGA
jgi:replication factor A1